MTHQDRACSTTIRIRSADAPDDAGRGELARWPRHEVQLNTATVTAATPAGEVTITSKAQLEALEAAHGRVALTVAAEDGSVTTARSATARTRTVAASVNRVRVGRTLDVTGDSEDARRVRRIADTVAAQGGRALIVGGAVRDAVAIHHGISVPGGGKDIDVEVFGVTPQRLEALLKNQFNVDTTGASFAVFKIAHSNIDVSLPRRESKTGSGHRGFDVTPDPTMSVEAAAQRRDFTINAMSYDPRTGELIDPTGGMADLEARRLDVVSDAFDEDPLRVLRGAQFIARFGLTATDATVARSASLVGEAGELAGERVWGEWEKLFSRGVQPGGGLSFLARAGWAGVTPGLRHLDDVQLERAAQRLNRWAQTTTLEGVDRLAAGCAVMFSDVDDAGGAAGVLSPLVAVSRTVRKLGNINASVEELQTAGVTDTAVRRLSAQHDGVGLWCDVAGAVVEPEHRHLVEAVSVRAAQLGVAQSAPVRLVSGDDLIAAGVKPGKELGGLLAVAYAAQLDGSVATTAEGVQAALASRSGGR